MFTESHFVSMAGAQLWQLTLVIVLVGAASVWFGRRRPFLAYALWMVVLAKALLPPLWASNAGLFGRVESPPLPNWLQTEAEFLPTTPSTPEAPQTSTAQPTSPHPANIVSPDISQSIPSILWIWLAGSVGLASFSAFLVWRRSCALRKSQLPVAPELAEQIEQLAKRLGVRQAVRVVVTANGMGPAMCGLWRPTLVLPHCIVEQQSLESILTHELIHLRRGDHLVTTLQCVVQIVWWFHPLVWWANRRICVLREFCCDQQSVRALDSQSSTYARSLLQVLEAKSELRPLYGYPGVRPVQITTTRIEEIMNMSHTFQSRTPVWSWAIALLLAVALLPGTGFSADKEAPVEAPTKESKKQKKLLVLKYGDGKPDGRKSIAGAGEMIRFELPDKTGHVRALKVHGSRYGHLQAPKEEFEVTLLSEDMTEVLHTELIRYSLFKRTKKSRWTYLPLKEPVELPQKFWVVLSFNAQRTKGVYVSYDTKTKGEYSRIGFNEEDARKTKFGGDWMVQVLLAK